MRLTSFKGIVQSIRSTYGLDSKGEKFLAIGDIKLEFSPSFTYEQGYMQIKDFCMQSLMTRGSRFKGRELRENEILTPLAENFIMFFKIIVLIILRGSSKTRRPVVQPYLSAGTYFPLFKIVLPVIEYC